MVASVFGTLLSSLFLPAITLAALNISEPGADYQFVNLDNQATYTVKGQCNANRAVQLSARSSAGTAVVSQSFTCPASGGFERVMNLRPLRDGRVSLKVSQLSNSSSRTVSKDTVLPDLTLERPNLTLTPTFTNPIRLFSGTCGSPGQQVILVEVMPSPPNREHGRSACKSDNRFEIPVNALDATEGSQVFRLRHTDTAGNTKYLSRTYVVTLPGSRRFMTGFGDRVEGVPESAGTTSLIDITGYDRSVPSDLNDFQLNLENQPLGVFAFQYQGGNPSQRSASLINDPAKPDNRILRYILSDNNVVENNIAKKGRVQATLNNMGNIKEFYYKVRIRFTEGFDFVQSFPHEMTWLTLAEFWNDGGWTPEASNPDLLQGFRISMNLRKPPGPAPLRFDVHGQRKTYRLVDGQLQERWVDVWADHNENQQLDVPFQQWITLEYYMKEGTDLDPDPAKRGKFFVAATVNGRRYILFKDEARYTMSPNMETGDGLNHLHPMKLYTGKYLINPMKAAGKRLVVDWDDFEIWTEKNVRP